MFVDKRCLEHGQSWTMWCAVVFDFDQQGFTKNDLNIDWDHVVCRSDVDGVLSQQVTWNPLNWHKLAQKKRFNWHFFTQNFNTNFEIRFYSNKNFKNSNFAQKIHASERTIVAHWDTSIQNPRRDLYVKEQASKQANERALPEILLSKHERAVSMTNEHVVARLLP